MDAPRDWSVHGSIRVSLGLLGDLEIAVSTAAASLLSVPWGLNSNFTVAKFKVTVSTNRSLSLGRPCGRGNEHRIRHGNGDIRSQGPRRAGGLHDVQYGILVVGAEEAILQHVRAGFVT